MFDLLFMAPASQSVEPPQKPGRFESRKFKALIEGQNMNGKRLCRVKHDVLLFV